MTWEQLIKKGLVKRASELTTLKRLSSHNISVDYVLGGGWVFGGIHLLSGIEGVGKSSLAMSVCQRLQQDYPDALTLVVDLERAWFIERLMEWNLDLNRINLARPSTLEEAYDLILSGMEHCALVVVDSVGAIAGMAEADTSVKERQYAVGVRELNAFLRRMVSILNRLPNPPIILLLSQVRAVIGHPGNDYAPLGGHGLRHYAHIWLEMRHRGRLMIETAKGEDKEVVGFLLSITSRKNKTAPSHRTAEAVLLIKPFKTLKPPAWDYYFDLLTWGLRVGVIRQSGSWFEVPEIGLRWQGKEQIYNLPYDVVEQLRTLTLKLALTDTNAASPLSDNP